MNSITELKEFLTTQANQFNIDLNSTEKVMSTQTPWGIDEQMKNLKGDSGVLYYLDRINYETVEIRGMSLDLRGEEPLSISRDERIKIEENK